MDADCAVVRRGQDQDLERQRQAAFQNVARSRRSPEADLRPDSPAPCSVHQSSEPDAIAARGVALYGVRVGLPASERTGPVAQWLEPTAHNGLVGGSNPPGPTIFNAFRVRTRFDRSRMFAFSSRISLVNRWSTWRHTSFGTRGSQVQILPLRPAIAPPETSIPTVSPTDTRGRLAIPTSAIRSPAERISA